MTSRKAHDQPVRHLRFGQGQKRPTAHRPSTARKLHSRRRLPKVPLLQQPGGLVVHDSLFSVFSESSYPRNSPSNEPPPESLQSALRIGRIARLKDSEPPFVAREVASVPSHTYRRQCQTLDLENDDTVVKTTSQAVLWKNFILPRLPGFLLCSLRTDVLVPPRRHTALQTSVSHPYVSCNLATSKERASRSRRGKDG